MTTYQIQCHLKYKIVQPTEFIFMVQVAPHPDQNILGEQLTMTRRSSGMNFRMLSIKTVISGCNS